LQYRVGPSGHKASGGQTEHGLLVEGVKRRRPWLENPIIFLYPFVFPCL